MLPISIDISETINAFSFSETDTKSFSNFLLDRVTDSFMSKWEEIVNKSLKKKASSYKA